jgi:serine/threonine protein kinase
MYTFLAGKPPFDTKGVKNTLNRVVNDNYDIPKNISNEAKDLISCLLQKKPEDRIPLESNIFSLLLLEINNPIFIYAFFFSIKKNIFI